MSASAALPRSLAIATLVGFLCAGCGGEEPVRSSDAGGGDEARGATSTPSPSTAGGADDVEPSYYFVDATEEAGLASFRQVNGNLDKEYILEGIGAGVALFDYDNDGDLDVYLTNGSSLQGFAPGAEPRDALFANDGTGHFTDVTAVAGLGDTEWTCGAFAVDYDGDGWTDLYLTNWGPNALLRNRGDGTFEDVTEASGLGDPDWGACANFFDYDKDGDLDLYLSNYVEFDAERMKAERPTMSYRGLTVYKGPRGLPAAADAFYENVGGGRFENVSKRAGVDSPKMFGFQSVVFDADGDGWLDVFVANDSQANFLWINDHEGGFEDGAFRHGIALNMFGAEQSGMGVAVGDYDGDLRPDVYVTHFSHDYSTMYRGVSGGSFVDATHRLKLVEETELDISWGCGMHDFDDDGDLELYAVNGHIYPQVDAANAGVTYRQRNDLFEFDGKTYRVPAGGAGPGFDDERVSRGAAVGDVDGDGDLDLLIGNLDDRPTLLRNDLAPEKRGNWILLDVVGTGGNREAIGARLVAHVGERRHLVLVGSGGSFLSHSDRRVHLGLGAATAVDRLEVTWPDGTAETFRDLEGGRVVRIEYGGGTEAE